MLNTLYQSPLQSMLFCINHRSIPRSDSIAASVDIVFDIGRSQTCPLPKQNTAWYKCWFFSRTRSCFSSVGNHVLCQYQFLAHQQNFQIQVLLTLNIQKTCKISLLSLIRWLQFFYDIIIYFMYFCCHYSAVSD